jgi:hypothetical protein
MAIIASNSYNGYLGVDVTNLTTSFETTRNLVATTNGNCFSITTANITLTNTYILLGGGGVYNGLTNGNGRNGGHSIYINADNATIINYGDLLGGGGGGGSHKDRYGSYTNYAGPGGGGSGGSYDGGSGIGGSLAFLSVNGSSGVSRGGGGGGAGGGLGGGGGVAGSGSGGAGGSFSNGAYIGINGSNNPSVNAAAGGGGYGGGNGGNAIGGGGPGGGGGGGGGNGGTGIGSLNGNLWGAGGKGGYSIFNNDKTGLILYNSQGGDNYGPLFYGATTTNNSSYLPTKYYIRVNSLTNYGQLYCTGWGAITTGSFNNIDIDPTSTLSVTTYKSVLVGNCFTTKTGGIFTSRFLNATYNINQSTPITVGAVSYRSYDLIIDNITLNLSGIMAASSLTLSGYLNNPAPSISYYINGLNQTSTTTGMVSIQNTSNYVSLYANYVVASGTGFTINSDQRIKKNVEYLSSAESLKLVNVLKPASFQYVDSMKGVVPKYGYLAQEVESVFPNLVYQNPAYIPNFYEIVKIEDSRRIILPTKNTESLAIGTKVQFYDIQNVVVLREVESIIDETSFTVSDAFLEGVETLFLYGQEVADYRSIDTDQINTVLLSALQETNKKIADQDKEIDGLKRTVEELGKKIDDSLQI